MIENEESFDALPIKWQLVIQRLRAECAKHRIDRNKARYEVAAIAAELAELKGAASGNVH
jgi:hypothetical protein